jgi:uncharacterized protein YdaU (DUF1376 family)
MAQFPNMPLWTDAYLGDTRHLSLEEHGAYLILLMCAWRSKDCNLPADDKKLAQMVGVGPKKWAKLKTSILEFFDEKNGQLTQKRLLKERFWVEEKRNQQSQAGKASALKRKKTTSTTVPTTEATGGATERQPPYPYPYSSYVDITDVISPLSESAIPTISDETRMAVSAYNEIAARVGLPKAQKITSTRRSKIKARLKDAGGIDGWHAALAKLEAATWMHGDNDNGWRADLDFMLQERSFTKLMEGSYDRNQTARNPGQGNAAPGRSDRASVAAAVNRVFDRRGDKC